MTRAPMAFPLPVAHHQQHQAPEVEEDDTLFDDFFNVQQFCNMSEDNENVHNHNSHDVTISDHVSENFDQWNCLETEDHGSSVGKLISFDGNCNNHFEADKEEELGLMEVVDLRFVDTLESSSTSSSYFCSFDQIAEEMAEPMYRQANYDEDEQSMIGEAMKRMEYERKFSASLYAFNGISECLRKIDGENLCKIDSNFDEENKDNKKETSQEQAGTRKSPTEMESRSSSFSSSSSYSVSSASSDLGCDRHLRSSLDFSPIYF